MSYSSHSTSRGRRFARIGLGLAALAIPAAAVAAVSTGTLSLKDTAAFFGGSPAYAQADQAKAGRIAANASEAAPKVAAADANEALKPFIEHAAQTGAKSCSGLLPVLGDMLTRGSSYAVQTSWNKDAGEKSAIQSLVGMNYKTADFDGEAAGILFAAPNAGDCDGTMVRVVPVSKSCDETVKLLPQGSKALDPLSGVKSYALGNGGTALMVPGANSCVVVSVDTARSNGSKVQ